MKFLQQCIKINYFRKLKKLLKLQFILPIILVSIPTFAFATTASMVGTIPDGDVSMKVLEAFFGQLTDNGTGDPMLNAIKIFNGGILILGGILATYTVLAGTLGTAHDGEMLGKKFSSVWIPIRYSIGTALVLPVVGGGYCVMQAIVMWLIVQGIGLADSTWAAYTDNISSTANLQPSTLTSKALLNTAQQALAYSICYQSYAKAINDALYTAVDLGFNHYTYQLTKTDAGYLYGDSSSLVRKAGCGEVLYPSKQPIDKVVNNDGATTNPGYFGDLGHIFKPMDMTPINQAHRDLTDKLVQTMDAEAKLIVNNANITPTDATKYYNQIVAASLAYSTGMQASISSVTGAGSGFNDIKVTAKEQGWMLSGAWFTRIIQMNQSVNVAVNSTPTVSNASPKMDSMLFSDAAKYIANYDKVINGNPNLTATSDIHGTEDTTSSNKTNGDGKSEDPSWIMSYIQSSITEALTGLDLTMLQNDSRHPLIIINDLGNHLVVETTSLMVLVAGVAGAISIATGAGASVMTVLDMFMGLPIAALIGISLSTEYIIPNLPYMLWIGAIVGWMLLVIEAIIAAPLWAIMHLHPNGDDLTGRGGNGYMLLLTLVLKPTLMVFGMLGAIMISAVAGEFINKTFYEVFMTNVGATGFSQLLALIMGTGLYFIVMFTFVKKCFGIIHQLPDQLLKWIGGGDQALGQFAGEFGQASDKATSTATSVLGEASSQAIGTLQTKGKERLSDISEQMAYKGGMANTGIKGFLGRNMGAFAGGVNSTVDGKSIGPGGNLLNLKGERGYSEQKKLDAQRSQQQMKDEQQQMKDEQQQMKDEQQTANSAFDNKYGNQASALRDNISKNLISDNGSQATPEEVSKFNEDFNKTLETLLELGGKAATKNFITSMDILEGTDGNPPSYSMAKKLSQSIIDDTVKQSVISNGYSEEAAELVNNMSKHELTGDTQAYIVKESLLAMKKMENSIGGNGKPIGKEAVELMIGRISNVDKNDQLSSFSQSFNQ
jgi:conjugal transfer/type IV secretion protein DotA/TraY